MPGRHKEQQGDQGGYGRVREFRDDRSHGPQGLLQMIHLHIKCVCVCVCVCVCYSLSRRDLGHLKKFITGNSLRGSVVNESN